MLCMLRIAGYEAMLKHMVDSFCHTAPCATSLLALPAPLEQTIRGHSTTSQLFFPNEGLSSKKHGTTVDAAMLTGYSAKFAQWLSFDLIMEKPRPSVL